MPHRAGPAASPSNRELLFDTFRQYDLLSIVFLIVSTGLIVLFHRNLAGWQSYAAVHIGLIAFIVTIVLATEKLKWRVLTVVRDVYPFGFFFFLFDEMEDLTHLVIPQWQNQLLIDIDRAIFGAHPTIWLERIISLPLTEFLELIYGTYYIVLPLGGFLLYVLARRDVFQRFVAAAAWAFYVGFLGYILLPAEGPWKTLATQQTTEFGDSFFKGIVAAIQKRGGIVGGCFPSTHVAVVVAAVTSIYFHMRRFFVPALLYGLLLSFATVYGRYHYAVDGIVGAVIGVLGGVIASKSDIRWTKHPPPEREVRS